MFIIFLFKVCIILRICIVFIWCVVSEPHLLTIFLHDDSAAPLTPRQSAVHTAGTTSGRGLPFCLSWVLLPGRGALKQQLKADGESSGTRENPECFPHDSPANSLLSSEMSKRIQKLATCLCSLQIPKAALEWERPTSDVFPSKMFNSFHTCDISFILFFPSVCWILGTES